MSVPGEHSPLDALADYWPREIISVVVPGLAVVLELVCLAAPLAMRDLTHAALNVVASATVLVSGVALSIVAGYANRSVTFRVVESVHTPAFKADRRADLWRYLLDHFGARHVEAALAGTPVWDDATDGEPLRLCHFPYCKLWLRVHRPELSVDNLETDINLSYAFLLPVLLTGPVVVRLVTLRVDVAGPMQAAAYVAATAVSALVAWPLLRRGLAKQAEEPVRALENFVIARSMAADLRPESRQRRTRVPSSQYPTLTVHWPPSSQ